MPELGEWYMTMFDKPLFQFFSGLLLGIVVTGALWLLHISYKGNVQKEEEDDQRTGD